MENLNCNDMDAGSMETSPAENEFLGSIPWAWLRTVFAIQPSYLIIALGLWHARALAKSAAFPVSIKVLANFVGLSHRTVQRGISAMGQAGIIQIEYKSGVCHTFTISENMDGRG